MSGAYLAIGSAISGMTKNQVIAFVISVVVCFLFMLSGLPLVLDFFPAQTPQFLLNVIASFSFLTHFEAIQKGVINLRDVVYFVSLIVLWLYVNKVVIAARKAA